MKFIFKWVNTYVHSFNRYVHIYMYIQIKVERLKTSLLERLLEYLPPPHTLSWTLNNFKDSNYCFLKGFFNARHPCLCCHLYSIENVYNMYICHILLQGMDDIGSTVSSNTFTICLSLWTQNIRTLFENSLVYSHNYDITSTNPFFLLFCNIPNYCVCFY